MASRKWMPSARLHLLRADGTTMSVSGMVPWEIYGRPKEKWSMKHRTRLWMNHGCKSFNPVRLTDTAYRYPAQDHHGISDAGR